MEIDETLRDALIATGALNLRKCRLCQLLVPGRFFIHGNEAILNPLFELCFSCINIMWDRGESPLRIASRQIEFLEDWLKNPVILED